MKPFILFAALCLLTWANLSAQVFDRAFTEQLRLWKTVELADGNLVSIGSSTFNTSVLIKTNRNGSFISSNSLGVGAPNDLQIAGAIFAVVGAKIMRINPDLTIAWSVTATDEYFKRVRPLSNGSLVALSDGITSRVSLHILDSQTGRTVSRKELIPPYLTTRLPEFAVIKDNIYALVKDSLWKFNSNGDLLKKLPFGMENLFDISATSDNALLVSRGESILFKVDTFGKQIWRREIWHKSWANTNNKGVLVVNEINSGRSSGEVSLLDNNGNLKWIRPIGEKTTELPFQARAGLQTSDGNFLIIGNTFIPSDSFRTIRSRLIKLSNDNLMYLNRIVGNAYISRQSPCKKDINDIARPYWLVGAKNSNGDVYWGMTDSTGAYSIRCDTGSYAVNLAPFIVSPNRTWRSCNAHSMRFVGYGKTDTVPVFHAFTDTFGLATTLDCAALQTDIGASRFIRCFPITIHVNYSNQGSLPAHNAYIIVQLDTAVEYLDASRPLSNRVGNKYYFSLGTIAPNFRTQLNISARIRCGDSTSRGQSVCLKAQIFADTTCPNSTLWTGADLTVEGKCQQDSVVFTISNKGNTASASRKVVIIENNTIKSLPNIQLNGRSSTTRSFPANGNTWRLTMEQEPFHPISTAPTAFVEGCQSNTAQIRSVGFVQNFAADDRALSVAQLCTVIVGASDPNDKTGYPLGYTDSHFIDQNQDLDYTIRFQNTGTDTAYTVVVRDTIDTRFLDISSLEFGASSHTYQPTIYDKNILQFTFNHILLVDSFKNEPASNGYLKFRIKQKKDVLIGSKINNSAAIYFDFNAPVITNIAQHTIGKPILLSTLSEHINSPKITVQVVPNPFSTQTVVKISENTPLSIKGIFELFDTNGRLVRTENYSKNEFILERQGLPAGIYFYKIKTVDGQFKAGKIVIQ